MSDNFHQDVFDNDFSYSENEENTELYEHLNIIVDKKQEPLRIDKFLLLYRQNSSRNTNL